MSFYLIYAVRTAFLAHLTAAKRVLMECSCEGSWMSRKAYGSRCVIEVNGHDTVSTEMYEKIKV